MPAELTLKGITKQFGADVQALKAVDLEVAGGERLAIIGPSGAGKSTLLRIIAGLEQPTSGCVFFDQKSARGLPPWRRRVAWLGQAPVLLPHLNVRQNLTFAMRGNSPNGSSHIDALAQQLNIGTLLDRDPRSLSGGERQRVALGRALLAEPEVVLLDEPLASLEPSFRSELRSILVAMLADSGLTSILVTHDLTDALNFGTRLVVLREGSIVDSGPPEAVYASPARREVASFLGDPPMNLLPCRIQIHGSVANVALEGDAGGSHHRDDPIPDVKAAIPLGRWDARNVAERSEVDLIGCVGVRPHSLRWMARASTLAAGPTLKAQLIRVESRGSYGLAFVDVGSCRCWVSLSPDVAPVPAIVGSVEIDAKSCVVYAADGHRLFDQRQYLGHVPRPE
jgi:ABC-type sugar transport system ATPase subunit